MKAYGKHNYAIQFNGTKWRLKISFTLEWLYLWGKNPCDRRLEILRSPLLLVGEETVFCPLLAVNLGHPDIIIAGHSNFRVVRALLNRQT
jgi:hypothetical protein